MQVFKYKLNPIGLETRAEMSKGSQILSAGIQGDDVCIWATFVKEKPIVERVFHIIGTGHEVPCLSLNHIGTVHQGVLVWHVFEEQQGDD
jgi:hypothetical protein